MVRSEIVDDCVALDYDAAVIGIDLDLGAWRPWGRSELRYAVMRRINPAPCLSAVFADRRRPPRHAKTSRAEVVPDAEYPIGKRTSCAPNFRRCAAICVPFVR